MSFNSLGTKIHKVHSSHLRKSHDKHKTKQESFYKQSHHPASEKISDCSPLKIKLKIKATEGIVEVINTVTSEQRTAIKSSISLDAAINPPKPLKPKKTVDKPLNVRIPQDVALADKPIHCGIADSVKTKKRKCKDKDGSAYAENSYSPERPILMLSPKKRKSKKKKESFAPQKQWKSETSLQQTKVLDKRKSFDTLRELFGYDYVEPSKLPPKKPKIELASNKGLEVPKKFHTQKKTILNTTIELYKKIQPKPHVVPSPVPKKEIRDWPLPFDLIFEIEKWLLPKCKPKRHSVDQLKTTVTDPVFRYISQKFKNSSNLVINKYLPRGLPDKEDVFRKVLAGKPIVVGKESNHPTNLENVFQSSLSSQELVIGSYEDAEEVETKSKTEVIPCSLESPPYGSQDSGYNSMASPSSDDADCSRAAKKSKSINMTGNSVRLTDVQFLKMCHNYSKNGASKRWFPNKLVKREVIVTKMFANGHNFKTPQQLPRINCTSAKNPKVHQVTKIRVISSIPHQEPKKEFSPRGFDHAKALHDRRIVYLGNIPSNYTVQSLREKFKRFGEIENIQIKAKECDETDLVNQRFLASQPLKGRSGNPGKRNIHKERRMKHFGFITFKKIAAAREVFEKRKELCNWNGGSINYGGRREFVQEEYADFDAEANNLNPGCSYKHNQENEVDYTQLLKKEQEKRGLIASPTFKRTPHSQNN